jgi:hypothetical protein
LWADPALSMIPARPENFEPADNTAVKDIMRYELLTALLLVGACAEQPSTPPTDYQRMHPNEPTPGSMQDLGAGVAALGKGFQTLGGAYNPQLQMQQQQQQFEAQQRALNPNYQPPAYTHCTTHTVGTGIYATVQTDCTSY